MWPLHRTIWATENCNYCSLMLARGGQNDILHKHHETAHVPMSFVAKAIIRPVVSKTWRDPLLEKGWVWRLQAGSILIITRCDLKWGKLQNGWIAFGFLSKPTKRGSSKCRPPTLCENNSPAFVVALRPLARGRLVNPRCASSMEAASRQRTARLGPWPLTDVPCMLKLSSIHN